MSTDFPAEMSVEQIIQGFKYLRWRTLPLGIEQWRDQLRHWYSSALLKPLVNKIDTSHVQLVEKASKLGHTVNVSPVGTVAPQTETYDEDGLLHEFNGSLTQILVASKYKTETESFRPQTAPRLQETEHQQQLAKEQQATRIFHIRECVKAIRDYMWLQSLMKGESSKCLSPPKSFPADYTVQRIRVLAEGTCVEAFDNNRTEDTHLLLYLFFAFLEHPNWMLRLFSGYNARVSAVNDDHRMKFELYDGREVAFTCEGVWDFMLKMFPIIGVNPSYGPGAKFLQNYKFI